MSNVPTGPSMTRTVEPGAKATDALRSRRLFAIRVTKREIDVGALTGSRRSRRRRHRSRPEGCASGVDAPMPTSAATKP